MGDDTQSAVSADEDPCRPEVGPQRKKEEVHVSAACSKQMPLGVGFLAAFLIYVIDARDIWKALREMGESSQDSPPYRLS